MKSIMLQIHTIESYEYVVCLNGNEGIWHHHTLYRIISERASEKFPRLIQFLADSIRSILQALTFQTHSDVGDVPRRRLDPNISVPLSPGWSTDSEVSVKYRLFLSRFEPYDEVLVDNELLIGGAIPLGDILNLDYIGWLFETRDDFYFSFEVVIRQTVSLSLWRQQKLIDVSITELDRRRQTRIVNHVAAVNQANADPPLKNYPQIIGDLDKEVIWGISMFAGARPESWQIEIDAINQPFTIEDFSSIVSRALREQSRPVLERIPTFLRQAHSESSDHLLEVVVTIPEIEPAIECTINVTLRDPARELYYSTGNAELDQCILDIHRQLLDHGIPVGPETEMYQQVLGQLLLYRYYCASKPGYIDANVAQMTENEGFHKHLYSQLGHQLAIVPVAEVFSELDIGNSRVDLLIGDIPTELKLEDRKTATTNDIVERYQGQAADYIARRGAPFGFLLVLDIVLDREQPTSRVDQDLRLTQVTNVSGASVVVITIVIRIPRPASDHTRLARRRA